MHGIDSLHHEGLTFVEPKLTSTFAKRKTKFQSLHHVKVNIECVLQFYKKNHT